MVVATLHAMANGGIHDQLGGGFHRYSTDSNWFVPHFEKMLYDQAQIAISYLEAFQITRDPQYAETARGITDAGLKTGVPLLFGVITADNIDQANARAGAKQDNKGYEAAAAAVEVVN